MKSRTIDNEEIEKLSFGNEKINIEIPKFTNALIVTTISDSKDGGQNVSTKTYNSEEIQKLYDNPDLLEKGAEEWVRAT